MAGRLSLVAAFAALLATHAIANDRICTRETLTRGPALTSLQATLEALFARQSGETPDAPPAATPSIELPDDLPAMEVLVVRVKNGKPVMACVDSKEAASRFLNAPSERIGGKIAEEK